jgi:hypothetical protein
MDSKNVNTGKKDAKGRIIYKGPRGGEFVRGAAGKKLPPAMGGSKERPAAKSPKRSESPTRGPRVNLPVEMLREIYKLSNTGTKSRMQLATKSKDVFPANTPLFAKIAKLIHDKRKVAAGAQSREMPVASFSEALDAKCKMTFEIYKSKTGLLTEDIQITLSGKPYPGPAGTTVYPKDARYGIKYNRSKAGDKINRIDTYYNIGSDKWEQHNKDVAYIVEYIKRSAANSKLPFP